MSLSNPLVVAIDFGTTYSGYAYSFKSDKTNVKTVNKWSKKMVSQKAPTSILLDPGGHFHSFGYDAEEHYEELLDDEKAVKWALFRKIKMYLYNSKKLVEGMKIMDVTESVEIPAMELFKMAIEFLKDHALKTVRDPTNTGREGSTLDEKSINFVLTVPAIWDNRARSFMKKAAVRAGIPETNLRLALESEAASIWCQTIPFTSEGAKYDLSTVGSKYMVVDIGGGTADITVHEKQADGKLRELHRAIGGDCGGTKVDEAFVQILENIMGTHAVARFKTECTRDFLELLKEFEVVKRTTGPYSEAKLKIRLPESLRNTCRDANKSALMRTFRKTIRTLKNDGISAEKDKLRIDAKKARGMYAYCVDKICRNIHKILKAPSVGRVGTILVVGGFSESSVVNDALRKEFQGVSLIFPPEPGLSIMKGAVLYGHDPSIIVSRIASFTYGFEYADVFDETKHKKKYSEYVGGRRMCTKLFQILVEKGSSVTNELRTPIPHLPRLDENNLMTFEMYLCTKPRPLYVNEPECKPLDRLQIRLTPDDKEVEATVFIQDQEMIVEVKRVKSGEVKSKSFDFK